MGLEVGAGKPVGGSVLRRRVRKVAGRVRHFRRLSAIGVKFKKVARAAVGPAVTYGLSIQGAAPHVVARMSNLVKHGWNAIPKGSSHWIASRMDRSPDSYPACVAVVGPIHNWALMIQAGEVSRDVLQSAWRSQYMRVASEPVDRT